MVVDILATSDLHGNLPDIKVPFDILCICGDICPAHDHYTAYQKEWIMEEFVGWINGLPFKNQFSVVMLTWGNHDFVGEMVSEEFITELTSKTGFRLNVLKHSGVTWFGRDGSVTLFGTPYCKIFGNWAFMVPDVTLDQKYLDIPDNLDILLSHDKKNPHMKRLLQAFLKNPKIAYIPPNMCTFAPQF